jgi:hypothetical protein
MMVVRVLRLMLFCSGSILAVIANGSCNDKKRCTDEQLESFRRYDCGDGTVECGENGVRLGPLTPQQQQSVACCRCDTNGEPSCKTCDELGY